MAIDDQIRDEKLQCDINREAAKISAWSSDKIKKHEYLTCEEILPSNPKKWQERLNLLILLLEKQAKTIEDQREKQVDTLKSLKSSDKQLLSIKDFISIERINPEIIDEIERIKEEKKKLIEVKWFTKIIIKPMIFKI